MGGLRMPELLVIGLIVLLLFGPGKLAGLGKGLGEGIRDFKKAMSGEDEKKPDAVASGEQRGAGAPSAGAAPSRGATDERST
jgi:sec-independent protein translocase protein TatA